MKLQQLRKLIREEIANLNTSIKVGDNVTIPQDLTTDPYGNRGQSGIVAYISNDQSTLVVEFSNGKLGIYDIDIFNGQTTTYDDVIERDRQKRSRWKPFKPPYHFETNL